VDNLTNPKKNDGKQPNQDSSKKTNKTDDIVHLNPNDFRDKP